jgi:hypothetical protein
MTNDPEGERMNGGEMRVIEADSKTRRPPRLSWLVCLFWGHEWARLYRKINPEALHPVLPIEQLPATMRHDWLELQANPVLLLSQFHKCLRCHAIKEFC